MLSIGDSIITKEDLRDYSVQVTEGGIRSVLSHGGYTVVSAPPPSGGLVVHYILNILNGTQL